MIGKIICSAGGIALAIGIVVAAKMYLQKRESEKVETIYVDELTVGEMKNWFSEKLTEDDLQGVLLYPTPENVKKWKLQSSGNSQENLLVQATYHKKQEKIVDYREIVFGTLSEKLKELLEENGGAIVIER